MANQRPVKMLEFNFADRSFASRRLTQGLTRSLSAFSSLMSDYFDPVIKTDQCAQYVDDTGIAAISPEQLTTNLRAVFKCIQNGEIKLIMAKSHCGTKKNRFPWTNDCTKWRHPSKTKNHEISEESQIPSIWKSIETIHWLSAFYRNYVPRWAERLNLFFQLLKTIENEGKIFIKL